MCFCKSALCPGPHGKMTFKNTVLEQLNLEVPFPTEWNFEFMGQKDKILFSTWYANNRNREEFKDEKKYIYHRYTGKKKKVEYGTHYRPE